jgi:ParB family transcriptional regulator, chromosome partitioning protein
MPETRAIPLHSITVAIRLRELRPDKVDALAQSMADQGLLQPIVVRPHKDGRYWLVAGLHRFEAAKKLKWKEMSCTVFDDMEADQAELIEIDENLIRSNLSPAEEAMHLTRRKELYEKVYGKSKAKGARAANKKMGKTKDATDNLSDAFSTDVAKKTGQTARNVRRKVARSKNVVVLPGIVGTSLDKRAARSTRWRSCRRRSSTASPRPHRGARRSAPLPRAGPRQCRRGCR